MSSSTTRTLDDVIDAILCCPKCGERWSSAELRLCLRCAPVLAEPPKDRAAAEPRFAVLDVEQPKRACATPKCAAAAVIGPFCYAHTIANWGYRA